MAKSLMSSKLRIYESNYFFEFLLQRKLSFTVEPRFNELPRDRGNAFGILRVNRGSFPYYNLSGAENFASLYRGLR